MSMLNESLEFYGGRELSSNELCFPSSNSTQDAQEAGVGTLAAAGRSVERLLELFPDIVDHDLDVVCHSDAGMVIQHPRA